jgi:hypothetical protein
MLSTNLLMQNLFPDHQGKQNFSRIDHCPESRAIEWANMKIIVTLCALTTSDI